MRRATAAVIAGALALALAGCETTAEKSARLQRAAKGREAADLAKQKAEERELRISHPSRKVEVRGAVLLHSSEGLAAVVTLVNHSGTALREVPVHIAVHGAGGRTVFSNDVTGQAPALIAASYVPAHGTFEWIDDQIEGVSGARSVSAEVGEGPAAGSSAPRIAVTGAHMTEEASGAGAEGEIVNDSDVEQRALVVYGLARRGTQIVAAGRAVVPSVPPRTPTRFQLFFIGDPRGARLEVAAPPSTFG